MLTRLYRRAQRAHPEFPILLIAMVLVALCDSAFMGTFNNFLASQFHISERTRGAIEAWRELPGLLCVLLMGLLAAVSETRIAGIAALASAAGCLGFILVGDIWAAMIAATVLRSTGEHLMMPVRTSIAIWLGGEHDRGRRLGQMSAAGVVGGIIGSAFVWTLFASTGGGPLGGGKGYAAESPAAQSLDLGKWQFDIVYWVMLAAAVGAAILLFRIRSVGNRAERASLVIKRRYWLYYVMHVLWGARKQVFLTFGSWVLVKVYHQGPSTFALTAIIAALIQIPLNPVVGRLIDRVGERPILLADAALQVLFCFGYARASHLGLGPQAALLLVCACYLTDQLTFSLGIARESYMAKIAESERDLSASISLGISINHVVSMVIPFFGGMLWEASERTNPGRGHEPVFYMAMGLAVLIGAFSSMVRTKPSARA